jgi:hypothetical protein
MDKIVDKPTIDEIKLKKIIDNDADLSFYDAARLRSYGDEWCMFGIVAEAQVSYPSSNDTSRIEWFTSGGLWGIESDSQQSYFSDVGKEELNDLKTHLEEFGVNTDNWDTLIRDVTPKEYY